MGKRIVALLTMIAMVLCFAPAVMASTDLGSSPVQLDICDGSISIVSGTDTVTYTQGGNVYTSAGGCVVTQSNISTPTANRIDISAASEDCLEVKLTIASIHIEATESPIALLDKAKITLTLVGDNVLTCTGKGSKTAGLLAADSTVLTIKGSGSLTAAGGDDGAGIGGGSCGAGGTITISSGTVAAIGGDDGAGIGGGYRGNGGSIAISGGIVTATSGEWGAGIGGGWSGNGGSITISGGQVTAQSIWESNGISAGAGIGGGSYCNGGTITISGGTVVATGDKYGAGIGGGGNGNGGTITISGGTVVATGAQGAGIGGGYKSDGGTITIQGGTVTASSSSAAGIGAGGGSSYYGYGKGGVVYISEADVTARGAFFAIGSASREIQYGCQSITIGYGATLNLSYVSKDGAPYQERIDITKQPESAGAALSGNCPLFEAAGEGHSGVTYQWQILGEDGKTWVDVDGQTSAATSFVMTEANDGSTYRCAITNGWGNTVYTDEVQSYILAFTKQPESVKTNLDEIAALEVTSSCSNVTYQWQRSYDGERWANVDKQTTPTLVVTTTHSENGAWYRCVITATNGDQLASEPAQIIVNTDAVTYSTDYYLEQADGSYVFAERVTMEGEAEDTVTAPENSFKHYTENTAKGTHSGIVADDNSLVLSRYYDRCEYTLTFETDGGTAISPIIAKHGTAIELPENVSRYGYVFDGWYLDEELTEEAEFTVMPTENTTVYAKWTAEGADRGTEYHINGITLLGSDYQEIDSVPNDSFYAQVSVTNLCSEHIDTLILAAYDENGRMLDLYFMYADPEVGQTFILGALIDNSDGEIAELRAFMIPKLGGPMVPLANSVSTKD